MKLKQPETGRQGVMRACLDLLEAERIRHFRMNSGDRIGSYISKRTGKTNNWRIRGHGGGTPDILMNLRLKGVSLFAVPCWIETKPTGGKLSPDQLQFKIEAEANGEIFLLIDDVAKLYEWIKENRER